LNRADFQRLSRIRVAEANVLLDNGHLLGAYYLLGYAVECALKACIAKQVRRYDFPDRHIVNDSYTHNITDLLSTAGLTRHLRIDAQIDKELDAHWAIAKDWSEQSRYETAISEVAVRSFYTAVTARRNGVLAWLTKWW
jgi:HEPN domain-containing protein